MQVIRQAAGEYQVSQGERKVRVFFSSTLKAWMATAEWDRHLYTDKLRTKAEAILNAKAMLSN